jgi:hypothetical protein
MDTAANTQGIARIVVRDESRNSPERHIGMAIVVDDRHVMTCCHVVNQALGEADFHRPIPDQHKRITVHFPYADNVTRGAHVVRWGLERQRQIDVAVLELEEVAPKAAGIASFTTFDARNLSWSCVGWNAQSMTREAQGRLGSTLAHGSRQLNGPDALAVRIEKGYSGAGVWCDEQRALVGMVVTRDREQELNGAAYAITVSELQELWNVAVRTSERDVAWAPWLSRLPDYLEQVKRRSDRHLSANVPSGAVDPTAAYIDSVVRTVERTQGPEPRPSGASPPRPEDIMEPREGRLSEFMTDSTPALLVIGEGGSGKSTSLLKLAADSARRRVNDHNAPIPVYVLLSHFDVKDNGFGRLVQMIANAVDLGVSEAEFLELWRGHVPRFIFLFDGLNEVPPPSQSACASALKEFVRRTPHRYVISSRPGEGVGLLALQAAGVKAVEIRRLQPSQVQSFLEPTLFTPRLERCAQVCPQVCS